MRRGTLIMIVGLFVLLTLTAIFQVLAGRHPRLRPTPLPGASSPATATASATT
jgi:hypothetical protein